MPTPKQPVRRKLTYGSPRAAKRAKTVTVLKSNMEMKALDNTLSSDTVSATGGIKLDSVCKIAQGTDENERIGRKIVLKKLLMRYVVNLYNGTDAANTDDGVRVIVYLDKQANGATATVTNILNSASYTSFNNLSNKDRFTILYDETTDISATAGAWNGTANVFGAHGITKTMFKEVNIPIQFSDTLGAITELRSNNVGVLLISDNGNINFKGTLRVRYVDN